MKDLAQRAINLAKIEGASYADIRMINDKHETIITKNGIIGSMSQADTIGFGIRVIVDGSWGFASSAETNPDEIDRVTKQAIQIAKASSMLQTEPVDLRPEPAYQDKWQSTYLIDPFEIPLQEKIDMLMEIDKVLTQKPEIAVATANLTFWMEHQIFANSEGSMIEQRILRSGGGFSATALNKETGETQKRSYPASFGGQNMQAGYELIHSLNLLDNAERIREEAIALLSAPQCPSGKMDLILEGSQLALQIHESVGHPSELDRVLGQEANYAGISFLTTEKYREFKFGSPIVDIVADSTVPGGLATFGYDDDGVRAQRWNLVKGGITWGYLTNREVAHVIGEERSKGCNRADGYSNIPMIRMVNISLNPGDWEFDDLIADTEKGIYMEVNRSWSIDQRRLNFQFGCEIGHLIENGKITGIVKNPTYQGITPEFWGSCDAICNDKYWTLWGVTNCGKGQPGQRAEMSHGAAPTRFRNVEVGVDR
ncbi:MAG: TldD/PmbA family protein [Candidatus Zixiibacteriota bacterium]